MSTYKAHPNSRTGDIYAELQRAWSFGETPSQLELARRLGVGTYTVYRATVRLKKAGFLHPDTRVLAPPDVFNLNQFLSAVFRNRAKIQKHGFSNVGYLDDDALKTRLLLHIAEAVKRGITFEELKCHNVNLSKTNPVIAASGPYRKRETFATSTVPTPWRQPGRRMKRETG